MDVIFSLGKKNKTKLQPDLLWERFRIQLDQHEASPTLPTLSADLLLYAVP
jgi:hypothetical protein